HLVGGGRATAQLRSLASALNLESSVLFGEAVEDVRTAFAEADIFVLPSRTEGMPNVLVEAMASGLPCVATRVSGSEDLIIDGQCGYLTPPEQPEALAGALLALLKDPKRARALGVAAQRRVAEEFHDLRLAERLIDLYQLAMARESSRGRRRAALVKEDMS